MVAVIHKMSYRNFAFRGWALGVSVPSPLTPPTNHLCYADTFTWERGCSINQFRKSLLPVFIQNIPAPDLLMNNNFH